MTYYLHSLHEIQASWAMLTTISNDIRDFDTLTV